jgi:hypothetical protein
MWADVLVLDRTELADRWCGRLQADIFTLGRVEGADRDLRRWRSRDSRGQAGQGDHEYRSFRCCRRGTVVWNERWIVIGKDVKRIADEGVRGM